MNTIKEDAHEIRRQRLARRTCEHRPAMLASRSRDQLCVITVRRLFAIHPVDNRNEPLHRRLDNRQPGE
jgi:hypothetical protein